METQNTQTNENTQANSSDEVQQSDQSQTSPPDEQPAASTPNVYIKPTIGRVVWFWREEPRSSDEQAEAAIVVYVHSDTEVSLVVFDRFGAPRPELQTWLVNDDATPRPTHRYATWMPFQLGQAQKSADQAK